MRFVVDPRFPAELRRHREGAGQSQAQLAARISSVKSHISDMENGKRNPSKSMADNIDRALGANGQLTALVEEGDHLNGDELDRLDYVTACPRRVDTGAVEALRGMLGHQRFLDDYVGATAVLPAATAAHRMVADLVAAASGRVRDEVLDLGAQSAQFLGWLHTTSANWAEAGMYFDRALEWGTERGDADMVGTVLSYKGHVAWLRGETGPIISLSQAARRDRTIYVGQRAYDAFQEARGHALVADLVAARNVLAEADLLAEANEVWLDRVPAWQYYRAPWFFALERGLVFRCMARHDRSYAARAVAELSAGLAGMPEEWRCAEWAGEYVVYLASACRADGDVVSAKATVERARRIATATSSGRVLAMAERVGQGI